MSRVIANQTNPWGRQTGETGNIDAQRSDLWVVDMTAAVQGVSDQLGVHLDAVPAYFAQSVSFPELRVKSDAIRRDSMPYQTPSWDDPPDMCKINFILEAAGVNNSTVYNLMDKWRAVTRAGRGAASTELSIPLNANYSITYAFDIRVMLLKGSYSAVSAAQQQQFQQQSTANTSSGIISNVFDIQRSSASLLQFQQPGDPSVAAQQARTVSIAAGTSRILASTAGDFDSNNDLEVSGLYLLKSAWPGGFKLSDLSYENAKAVMLDVQFYVENVMDTYTGVTP